MANSKPKASPAVVKQRTEELLRIILDGAESPWDTCAFVREKEKETGSAWELPPDGKPLSESQIRRYVAKATAMIAESCRASRGKLLRRHLAMRRNLYAKSLSVGDIRTALACLADEAKLLALYDSGLAELEKRIASLESAKGQNLTKTREMA